MNQDQTERLIRVDQNVINLVDIMNKHILDDKEFQKDMTETVNTLKNEQSERRGIVKFATVSYSIISSLIGAFIGVKYGR